MIKESVTKSETIRLQIIPTNTVNARGIVNMTGPKPAFRGQGGGYNYICGFCEIILAEDVKKGEITNKVVKCYDCQKYNQFP
jgi:hypothetical protein